VIRSRRGAVVLALACVGLAYATGIQALGWNQSSHYALIRALDRGTARIDDYKYTTGDKARFHGHWFSSRAPGLAFFSEPAYKAVRVAGLTNRPTVRIAGRHNNEVVWLLSLFAAALPALVMVALVWRVGDRLEPGFGFAAAVALGLGTLVLPFSQLLFSHVFSACLGFAAFALLFRERMQPSRRRLWPFALAGLCIGYGVTTEYPLLFVGIALGVYAITSGEAIRRGAAYAAGVIAGVVPLALYNLWAFGSVTHVAYADIPRQHAGFFGIRMPSPAVAAELLLSSRGLLTVAPVLVMGIVGAVLLYRRGNRAEALLIGAIGLIFIAYNSGYYLPYGGRVPGPRFLITTLPFLAVPLAVSFRRFPGPTVALAAVSFVTFGVATITNPLVSAEGDVGQWTDLLFGGHLQPTFISILKVHNEWLAMAPFFVAVPAALVLAVRATPGLVVRWPSVVAGAAAAGGWALFAVLGPKAFGIDLAAERKIVAAGDSSATLNVYGTHPLHDLAEMALAGAVVALLAMRVVTARRSRARAAPDLAAAHAPRPREAEAVPAS